MGDKGDSYIYYKNIAEGDQLDGFVHKTEFKKPDCQSGIREGESLSVALRDTCNAPDRVAVFEFATSRKRSIGRIIANGDHRLPGGLTAVIVDDADRLKMPVIASIYDHELSDLLDRRWDIRVFFGDGPRNYKHERSFAVGNGSTVSPDVKVKGFFPSNTGRALRFRSVVLPDTTMRVSVSNYGSPLSLNFGILACNFCQKNFRDLSGRVVLRSWHEC